MTDEDNVTAATAIAAVSTASVSAHPSSRRFPISGRDLSLRRRLSLRLGVVFAELFGLGGAKWLALSASNQQMTSLFSDTPQPVAELGRILNDYAEALTARPTPPWLA